MDGFIFLFFLLGFVFISVKIFEKYIQPSINSSAEGKRDFHGVFIKRPYFFTHSERALFEELERQNDGRFLIFSKVRLEDVVSVKNSIGGRKRKIERNYIKSKHLDFLLVDRRSGAVLAAIELNGASHSKQLQRKYDQIKESVLADADVSLYKVHVGENFVEKVQEIYRSLI